MLSFTSVEEEEIYFNNEFLQENVLQMTIARISEQRETYCTSLALTIKGIFDNQLFKTDNLVIYLSVESDKWKEKLITRYILEDSNDEFCCYSIQIDGYSFYFFFNRDKTNSVECLSSIFKYFKTEFNIDLIKLHKESGDGVIPK